MLDAAVSVIVPHIAVSGVDGEPLVAVAVAGAVAARGAGVALPAQELGGLNLDRGLQQQPRPDPGDLLDRRREVRATGEHLIDLGAQPLAERYSLQHGRGLLLVDLVVSRGTYVRGTHCTGAATRPIVPLDAEINAEAERQTA